MNEEGKYDGCSQTLIPFQRSKVPSIRIKYPFKVRFSQQWSIPISFLMPAHQCCTQWFQPDPNCFCCLFFFPVQVLGTVCCGQVLSSCVQVSPAGVHKGKVLLWRGQERILRPQSSGKSVLDWEGGELLHCALCGNCNHTDRGRIKPYYFVMWSGKNHPTLH